MLSLDIDILARIETIAQPSPVAGGARRDFFLSKNCKIDKRKAQKKNVSLRNLMKIDERTKLESGNAEPCAR